MLDTDCASQYSKAVPEPRVLRWLVQTDLSLIYLSVVTLQEIKVGLEQLPSGRRRQGLESWFRDDLPIRFAGRILPLTEEIAIVAGICFATELRQGYNPGVADVQIAATALHHGMALATLNRKHFARLGVPLVTL